jgi:hypothetical protein
MTQSFLFRWEIILQAVFIIQHYTRLKSSDGIAFSKCGYKTGDWAHKDKQIWKRQSLFQYDSGATFLYVPSILIGFCSEMSSHFETELDVLLKNLTWYFKVYLPEAAFMLTL